MDEKDIFGYGYIDERGNGANLNDYSDETLKALEDAGMRFVRVYVDGSHEFVTRDEVKEPPKPEPVLLPVISYEMWQKVMTPLRALMANSMQPAVAMVPATFRTNINTNYNDFLEALDSIDKFFSENLPDNEGGA